MKKIVIGTRGSELSLKQTEIIKTLLLEKNKNLEIEIKIISTKGDRNLSPIPLDTIGKGWFTKELDRELIKGSIDMAVHSLKDVPEPLDERLIIAAVPQREDLRDVLVSKNKIFLEKLKKNAVIGTDSLRRKLQVLSMREDLKVKSVRGNINTRLSKLFDGNQYDGLILAAAGLKRLGFEDKITEYFPAAKFISSPGQGALAVIIKKTNTALLKLLKEIEDEKVKKEVDAERLFSEKLGGGCKLPVGAYAQIRGKSITITGMAGISGVNKIIIDKIKGDIKESNKLAGILAARILKKSKDYERKTEKERFVVITREERENKKFRKNLEKQGIKVFEYPCIKILENILTKKEEEKLLTVSSYDWIVFTSKNAVTFFIDSLKKLDADKNLPGNLKIAAVGPETAGTIRKYGLYVNFMPSVFTTKSLALQIKNIRGKKILLPRSKLASNLLEEILSKKGAIVTNIPIYKTEYVREKNHKFKELVTAEKIRYITFTSPSTVNGFIKSIERNFFLKNISQIPVLAIGPVTAKEAEEKGFKNVKTVSPHTIDAMIKTLKENDLS